jgi:DNA-binding transcriptional regulator PaaX
LEQKAEEIYYELSAAQNKRLAEIENKMKKYFRDKEESINRIAVENIRQAKLRELKRDIENNRAELQQRKMLIPSLKCEQVAYVEFV